MKKTVNFYKFLLFFFPKLVFGLSDQLPELGRIPWFTGSLLTPAAYTVPQGHINLEPYLYINNTIGNYGNHWKPHRTETFTTISSQVLFSLGLTSFMDIQTFPQVVYNHTSNQSAIRFADLPIQVNFRLCREKLGTWVPDVKLGILEVFPTGKFDKLNPEKKGTDASGEGSYNTVFGIFISKRLIFKDFHYLRTQFVFSYSVPSAVNVNGTNVYGGGDGTHGKIYPANEFVSSIGIEYSPVLHWAFALDIVGIMGSKTKFSGGNGSTTSAPITIGESVLPFEVVAVGRKSFEQLSLAPAIEYNFSQTMGLITGFWFSILGRNSPQFVNGVMALNMYF